MFELKNKRLAVLADMVKNCDCVADIGTDHAHLPIELVLKGKCKKAVACDVKKGPLEVAKKNISQYGLSEKIELRLGFGLEVLSPSECDVITVAGMGGLMICDILEKSRQVAESAGQLVLQPNTCEYDFRKYLYENGYVIEDERGIKDGDHFYLAVSCRYRGMLQEKTLSETDCDNLYYTGSVMPLRLNADDRSYLENLRHKAEKVLEGIALCEGGLTEENRVKKQRYEALLKRLDNILE